MCNNCINEQIQTERDELRLQVAALTQALETQKRENQPYIKELEALLQASLSVVEDIIHQDEYYPEGESISSHTIEEAKQLCTRIKNATGGDKPE